MFSSLASKAKNLKDSVTTASVVDSAKSIEINPETIEKVKSYIQKNKEEIKAKVSGNDELVKAITDKAVAVVSISLIAGILYALLPTPVQWVVSEEVFEASIEENLDFIIETLA